MLNTRYQLISLRVASSIFISPSLFTCVVGLFLQSNTQLTVVSDLPHALPQATVGHVRVHYRIGGGVGAAILLHRQSFLPGRARAGWITPRPPGK